MNTTVYNQGDARWRYHRLGESPLTIGSWGCTMTCVTMLLPQFGIHGKTPDEVNDDLTAVDGFMSNGNLLWTKIHEAYPSIHFKWRGATTLDTTSNFQKETVSRVLRKIRNLTDKGMPVLLNVDNVGHDGRPDHWVLCVGHTPSDLLINDPDGGKELRFSAKYGSPEEGVYGYAVLVGPPQGFNEDSPEAVRSAGTALWKAMELKEAYYRGQRYKIDTYIREIPDDLAQ